MKARQIIEAEIGMGRFALGKLRKLRRHLKKKTGWQELDTKARDVAELVKPFHYRAALGNFERDENYEKALASADPPLRWALLKRVAWMALLASPQAYQAYESALTDLGLGNADDEPGTEENKFADMVADAIAEMFERYEG